MSACSVSWNQAAYEPLAYSPEIIKQQVQEMEQRRQSFIGFALYDPELDTMLVEYHSDKYFMPASDTKLFTLYASQKMLGDSIPALKYALRGDSLFFWDPTEVALAQNDIHETIAFKFLESRSEKLYCINATPTSLTNAIDWGWDAYKIRQLADNIKRPIKLIERTIPGDAQVLYGLSADAVYKRMLQPGDNLLAEQLLVLSSGILSDTLSGERAIRHMLRTHLADLPDKPVWVDGSGLSTMNMITPRTVVALLQKLLDEIPQDELFPLLTEGDGTYHNIYTADEPFSFGEAGTLAHVHNQSGYIITKRGKILLYSFMNNNFNTPSSEIRHDMAQIMAKVHEKY